MWNYQFILKYKPVLKKSINSYKVCTISTATNLIPLETVNTSYNSYFHLHSICLIHLCSSSTQRLVFISKHRSVFVPAIYLFYLWLFGANLLGFIGSLNKIQYTMTISSKILVIYIFKFCLNEIKINTTQWNTKEMQLNTM